MDKYIFLDIDGVLNNTASRNKTRCKFHHVLSFGMELTKNDLDIDETCMGLIKDLILQHNSKVVISSTWRVGAQKDWFICMFELYGLYLDSVDFLDIEDDESNDGMRGKLVYQYLRDNNITCFVCVDDKQVHYDILLDHLVLTSMDTGFTQEHYDKCSEILQSC